MSHYHKKGVHNRNDNELRAISFAHELINKYEVFDKCIVNLMLDMAGIDMLLVKKLGSQKSFRFHIQHKSSQKSANSFRKHNPCIPVWIVNKNIKSDEAITSLLNLIIEKALKYQSPYADFFIKKYEEITNFYNTPRS